MMKIILPLTLLTIPLLTTPSFLLIFLSLTLLMSPIILFQQNTMISSSMLTMHDNTSSILILLSLISSNLILLSNNNFNMIKKTIPLILTFLLLTFLSSNSIMFYIAFELTLIPTFFLILTKGKQPERMQAGFYLLIYTLTASLPFLIFISNSLNTQSLLLLHTKCSFNNAFWIILLVFLVKMPMFLTHLWLPKAHVEAPLEGSMILAAILLKLGGYGMIRFLPLILMNANKLNHWLMSISLTGAVATSMNCIRQKDLKSLIAYSSVAHMAFAIIGLSTLNSMGLNGAMLMMISHGLTSSALFFLVNIIYFKSHTRNTLMFKGMLMIFPNLTLWWFIFMALNISAPPSTNTISEIMIIFSSTQWNLITLMIFPCAILAVAMFSMNLFLNTIHNSSSLNKPHLNQPSKSYLSLTLHLLPLILMLSKMETMTELWQISLQNNDLWNHKNKINKTFLVPFNLAMLFLLTSLMMLYKSTSMVLEFNFLNMFFYPLILNLMIDWPASMFMSTVLFITSMIMLFSNKYIPPQEIHRFITIMLLFVISMILLIISNNPLTLIMGWDGLGLSSYILVAYYQDYKTSSSSTLTIMSNRMGDIALMIAISTTLMIPNNFLMTSSFPKISSFLMMLAALTKSAQFPFSAWLPAAMAAPTPISALVHSSTLVTAGMYLLLRTNTPFHPHLSLILLTLSSFTMIMAGLIANWEQDLKKIIAFSTLSQIAMMMFSIAINAPSLAFFHLITHAMFKSTMFMCAGILISTSTYQDIRKTTHFKSLPIPSISLGISNMALMGLPFSSGFYSKHLILENTLCKHTLPSIIMTLSIGLTASYSLRLMSLSMKNFLKTTPDTSQLNTPMNLPLIIMTPWSIILGSSLSWISLPEQSHLLTTLQKLSSIVPLLMGGLLGIVLHYKTPFFLKMSETNISLWYSHFASTHTFKTLNTPNLINSKNDKLWMEFFGPQGILFLITLLSKTINKSSTSLILLLLTLLLPMMMWI